MQTPLRKMGNSQGILIPQALLAQLGIGLGQNLEILFEAGEIRLRPVTDNPREGWAEAAQAIAAAGDDAPVWPDFSNEDDEAWEW